MTIWFDMHQHTGFVPDSAAFVQGLSKLDVVSVCVTVTPDEYTEMQEYLSSCEGVQLGVGLHPWWIADGRCGATDLIRAQEIIHEIARNGAPRIVGEIGLDFSKRFIQDAQNDVPGEEGRDPFAEQISACRGMFEATRMVELNSTLSEREDSTRKRPWMFSLHSVKADDAVLDIVQEHLQAVEGRGDIVILHSFCGSSQQLMRARDMGCYFSISQRMLRTKKGREYVKAIPVDKMLLETDLPSEAGMSMEPSEITKALADTCAMIETIRGHEVADCIMTTSAWVLEQAR